MEIAFYRALDEWVNLLAQQNIKREAGQQVLTQAELEAEWNNIFALPSQLNTGLASATKWAWKCFRFKHPYLSVIAPLCAALLVLNVIFGVLYSR